NNNQNGFNNQNSFNNNQNGFNNQAKAGFNNNSGFNANSGFNNAKPANSFSAGATASGFNAEKPANGAFGNTSFNAPEFKANNSFAQGKDLNDQPTPEAKESKEKGSTAEVTTTTADDDAIPF
ncbi:hypothetical protein, partial [Psittacicella hinzii]